MTKFQRDSFLRQDNLQNFQAVNLQHRNFSNETLSDYPIKLTWMAVTSTAANVLRRSNAIVTNWRTSCGRSTGVECSESYKPNWPEGFKRRLYSKDIIPHSFDVWRESVSLAA